MKRRLRTPRLITILIVLSSVCFTFAQVHAQNLLTNGSFENTSNTFVNNGQGFMNLAPGSSVIPGWTVTSNTLSWINNTNPFSLTASDGSFFLDLTGPQDSAAFGGVTQTIATTPFNTYTLSLTIGAGGTSAPYGGTKSVMVTAGSSSTTFTFTPVGSGSQWGTFSFDFVPTTSSTAISIAGTASGVGNQYLGLDNVSVVPEPSTAVIFLGGMAFLGSSFFLRRRRAGSAA